MIPNKIIEKIVKALSRFLISKQYVYRFDYYTGSAGESGDVSDTQVVEYEFINQGSTVILINGMMLLPGYYGIEPSRWKSTVNYNEMDVSIYKYSFPKESIQAPLVIDVVDGANVIPTPVISPLVYPLPGDPPGNRLLVISKCKATVRTSNP
jgi:hypothetical protein